MTMRYERHWELYSWCWCQWGWLFVGTSICTCHFLHHICSSIPLHCSYSRWWKELLSLLLKGSSVKSCLPMCIYSVLAVLFLVWNWQHFNRIYRHSRLPFSLWIQCSCIIQDRLWSTTLLSSTTRHFHWSWGIPSQSFCALTRNTPMASLNTIKHVLLYCFRFCDSVCFCFLMCDCSSVFERVSKKEVFCSIETKWTVEACLDHDSAFILAKSSCVRIHAQQKNDYTHI